MIFSNEENEYLNGKKFSNGMSFTFKNNAKTLYRDEFLLDISKDKTIIHLGFVDHLPLIDAKIKDNRWLHNKLIKVSNTCYGIDINSDGIEYIQNKYNIENLYALDILNDEIPNEIKMKKIDYLLIPDVIEHIGNPVAFLTAIRERFENQIDKIIITTPNALRLNNFLNLLKNKEVINTDHRFWFTPYTISKIAIDAGYKIEDLGFYEHGRLSIVNFIRKILFKKFFFLKDTLILELSLKND